MINQCSNHLLTLINDILDFSKLESGKIELSPTEFHFSQFIEEIIEICRIQAQQKQIDLIYQSEGKLPKGIEADKQRLRQVLMNLINNAIKFTDTGKVIFTVKVQKIESCQNEEKFYNYLLFQVEDNGIGIDSNDLEKIFLPFEQLDKIQQKSDGTGVGLTISQKIVSAMDSTIQVASKPGKGSTFWFEVKLPETNFGKNELQVEQTSPIAEPFQLENNSTLIHIADSNSQTIIPPGIEELSLLNDLIRKGLLNNLIAELDRIERIDRKFIPFTQKLRQLTKNFQLKELRNMIKQYL